MLKVRPGGESGAGLAAPKGKRAAVARDGTVQGRTMTAEHLKPLTSLRFIAAMWVVMFHYWTALDV